MTAAKIGFTPLDTPTTNEAGFALGTRHEDHRGYEYIYVQANGAITQYDFVVFDEAFDAYAVTAALGEDHPSGGVAQVAFADNDFGWILVRGVGQVRALANCVAETQLYTSGTAGALDDADASQRAVIGIRLSATNGASTAAVACYLDHPKTIVAFDGA